MSNKFSDFLNECLQDPEVKKEYDRLQDETNDELFFESSLSMEEIDKNFEGVDVFDGLVQGLEAALDHKRKASLSSRYRIKEIFESDPVSRSQAKSLCQRFNSDTKIVFDFEDIEWIGQGFAHQLFVIFQREHPEIQFILENMNEAVTKMYHHVMNT